MAKSSKNVPSTAFEVPTVYPVSIFVKWSDGSGLEFPAGHFGAPKASAVSGKVNSNASGKVIGPSGARFQLGCNVTRLE